MRMEEGQSQRGLGLQRELPRGDYGALAVVPAALLVTRNAARSRLVVLALGLLASSARLALTLRRDVSIIAQARMTWSERFYGDHRAGGVSAMRAKITMSSAKWMIHAQPDPRVSIMLRASTKPKIVAPTTPRSPEGLP
jgi:hypothetical protein